MVVRATGINPTMLRWARERAGYSIDGVASRMKREPSEISAWESGKEFPTWRQFERLARDLYHRPTALFFFLEPPEEDLPTAEFRRLPATALEDLDPDTWLAVRQAKARQLDLADLAEYDDPNARQIIADLSTHVGPDSVDELASETRRYFGILPDEQFEWGSDDNALEKWRDVVQSVGVWVFKRSFRQRDIAGFCLDGNLYPLVYLNNGQPKVRQIFTLFHELAHLLFGFNHLERTDVQHYLGSLHGHDREVEVACNRFAGEFLVPASHFVRQLGPNPDQEPTDEILTELSRNYRVSREVILRKYFDQGWIDSAFYEETVAQWRSQRYEAPAKAPTGGNYFANQGTYLGTKYAALAFRGYYRGDYDVDQLAEYLDIKASNIAGLEQWLARRLSSE